MYLEEEPPEKATRTLSVGEIMAFEVTANRNFPNKLLLKQSMQKRPSSIPPYPETASFSLHLIHRLLGVFESFSADDFGWSHVGSSSL